MRLRVRLLQAANVALYMGPLLAGLGGYGWSMVLPFVLIFSLWLALSRPHQWPQNNRDWLVPQVLVVVAAQVLVQLLLVVLCLGIGRGIGGVLGYLPVFQPLLPVTISFLAITLLRFGWDGVQAMREGLSIDDLLYPIPPRQS